LIELKDIIGEFMKLIILFSLIVLASCGSTDVTKPTRSQYAPKDYRPVGMVKYLNEGMDSMKASRKDDAFKKMSENCNGKYKVTSEGPGNEGGVAHGTQGTAVWATSQYWYISYECLE
jgi:hypothetical protein